MDLFSCHFGPVTHVLLGRVRVLACLVSLGMLCTHQCKSIATLERECWSHNQTGLWVIEGSLSGTCLRQLKASL